MSHIELQVTSNFSFLRGASHPAELVAQAAAYGEPAIAITDRNTLAGIVRAHAAAKNHGIRILPGARLDLLDGPSLLALPTDKDAYGRLSALLTVGNLRTEKGECHLHRADVYQYAKGMKFIIIPPNRLNNLFDYDQAFHHDVAEYREAFGADCYLSACRYYRGDDSKHLFRQAEISSQLDIPMVATNDIHYHIPERRELQDILTCVREKCTIHNAGYRLHPNAERHLKHPEEMRRLFRQYPDAIRRTNEIAEACQFSMDSLEYVYPTEVTSHGRTPAEELAHLAWEGARFYWGDNIPEKISANIHKELAFYRRKNLEMYFLTVADICREARDRKILYQGRGSAANSTVCYCLRITFVDPTEFQLFFERFISDARDEPPDIDVDFEHQRREEIIQYIYDKYGRDRAAIVATVTQVHAKGAIRDVGKAMGLSVDAVDRLSKSIHEFTDWLDPNQVTTEGIDPKDTHLQKVLELTAQYIGFPRQLGQHTGGFLITQGKLTDLCPILNARMEDRTNIEWDKDDIDILGFLKIDVLALGMLTAIRKAFDFAKQHYDLDLTLANVPQNDFAVFDMMTAADTIGVFQIESRAQQSMLPRMKPKCKYDVVIEVAIVRPGPIQGGMVHPYINRRMGLEKVEYPSPALQEILERTLGVPLFQEQVMMIAVVAAGFTPTEADELRRSMATFKVQGLVSRFREKLVQGMVKNGFAEEYAMRIFKQIEGFGSYGFPESHAAAFAHLVIISAWTKCHYPDVFLCAILNSLPMGFYQPAQLIYDAQKHGVIVRPIDINYSQWDSILVERTGRYHAALLGFRLIDGIRDEDIVLLIAHRTTPFTSIKALQDIGLSYATLEKLAGADAFNSIGLDRRKALWQVAALNKAGFISTPKGKQPTQEGRPLNLFEEYDDAVILPKMILSEHVVHDYASTAFSLKAHPVSFLRENLRALHAVSAIEHRNGQNGQPITVAGLVFVRQRPETAKGTCFISMEDETSTINLIVWASIFDQYRTQILGAKLLLAEGNLQIAHGVVHVIVQRCHNIDFLLSLLTPNQQDDLIRLTLSRADQKDGSPFPEDLQSAKPFPGGRNFK